MKLLKGKRLKSVASAGTQPSFRLVHFLVDGPASILTVGKGLGKCGTFWCVIVFSRIRRSGSRNAARRKAGVRPLSRLGCWHNGFKRPVLKHGPRSLTYMQVTQPSCWWAKLMQKAPRAPRGLRNALLGGSPDLHWSLSMSC